MKIALALSFLAAGVLLAVENSDTDARSKIKALQKELIATLKEVADVASTGRLAAQISVVDALHAQRQFLDATLEASETSPEKIVVLESIVEVQKKIEAAVERGYQAATVNYMEVLKAKAARIKAEIALEKEKSNAVK